MAGQFCANCGQGAASRNPHPQQHHHQQQQAPSAPPAPYPAMSAVPMAAPVASGGGSAAAAWTAPAAAPAPFTRAVPAAAAAAAATAPPPAAVDETITVRSAGAQLVTAEAKPFREYAFAIEAGGAPPHTLRGRFSRLQQSLCCSGGGGGGGGHAAWRAASASFPSSHVFRDYTGNEANVARRAEELRAYLDLLLRCGAAGSEGALLADGGFRAMALQLPPGAPLNAALASIGAARRQRADHARAAEAARRAAAEAQEAARLAAIAAEQAGDCAFAQTFNQATAYAALPMGSVTTVAFPRPQRFELRNKMWGFGDALIRGPGGHPWFRMARTNPSLFGEAFRNCHFAITTMAGEPLLSLQEQFSWMNYKYDLARVDPRTGGLVPLCRVVRQWTMFSFTDVYVIELYGAGAVTTGGGGVQCTGSWPNQFTLSLASNGAVAATVDKQMFSFTDKYHVQLAPGMDALLFLGIACAIDRIHHEVEDARRSRQ